MVSRLLTILFFLLSTFAFAQNDGDTWKSDYGNTPAACLRGFLGAMSATVPHLRFTGYCSQNPDTKKYNWVFTYEGRTHSSAKAKSFNSCVDDLASSLNDEISRLDISVNYRCLNKETAVDGKDAYTWKFIYKKPEK